MAYRRSPSANEKSEAPIHKSSGDGKTVEIPFYFGADGNIDGKKLGDILKAIREDLSSLQVFGSGLKVSVENHGGTVSGVTDVTLYTAAGTKFNY